MGDVRIRQPGARLDDRVERREVREPRFGSVDRDPRRNALEIRRHRACVVFHALYECIIVVAALVDHVRFFGRRRARRDGLCDRDQRNGDQERAGDPVGRGEAQARGIEREQEERRHGHQHPPEHEVAADTCDVRSVPEGDQERARAHRTERRPPARAIVAERGVRSEGGGEDREAGQRHGPRTTDVQKDIAETDAPPRRAAGLGEVRVREELPVIAAAPQREGHPEEQDRGRKCGDRPDLAARRGEEDDAAHRGEDDALVPRQAGEAEENAGEERAPGNGRRVAEKDEERSAEDQRREEGRLETARRERRPVRMERADQSRDGHDGHGRSRALFARPETRAHLVVRPDQRRDRDGVRRDPPDDRRGLRAQPGPERAGKSKCPERVAVALDALARVEHRTEPVRQVARVAKADERIVAEPREEARMRDRHHDDEHGHEPGNPAGDHRHILNEPLREPVFCSGSEILCAKLTDPDERRMPL